MDSFDNMDIEDMINNPFKNVKLDTTSKSISDAKKGLPGSMKGKKWEIPQRREMTEDDIERMGKNHPIEDRVLCLEKNCIVADKNNDTLKRIIEQQNERISKIEEELDILRKHLGGDDISIQDIKI